jgi:hypothetical protein
MRHEAREQLGVGTPAVGFEQAPLDVLTQRLAQRDEAEGQEPGHGVMHAPYPQQSRRPAADPAMDTRPFARLLHLFAHHEIGTRFDPLHHVVHRVGRVDEIGGQGDGTVALGPVGALQGKAQQLLEATGVSQALAVVTTVMENAIVASHHITGAVGGAVVADQQLVLALEGGEHLPDLPQDESSGLRLVVHGNTDVDHGPAI